MKIQNPVAHFLPRRILIDRFKKCWMHMHVNKQILTPFL
jgi:hypothetical protein